LKRKEFIWLLPAFFILGVAWVWRKAVRRDRLSRERIRVIPIAARGEPLQMTRDVIIVRSGDRPRAFLGRCTHLGCRLQLMTGGQLVCPCHGSVFGSDGRVERGPALKSLRELPVHLNPVTKQYYTEISET